MKLTTAAFFVLAIASATAANQGQGNAGKVLQAEDLSGIDDVTGYAAVAKKFVGLNEKFGEGSGFVINAGNTGDIKSDPFPSVDMLNSNTGRNNLCTCDCVAGPDGIGCVGWGGIAFRYSSMLSIDPAENRDLDNANIVWSGQIQAFQPTPSNKLNFIGTDTRYGVGGPAIYSVACTDSMCDGIISGTFRQSNDRVSCEAGLADRDGMGGAASCAVRCGNSGAYEDWLDYCEADDEDTTLGFSGYGI